MDNIIKILNLYHHIFENDMNYILNSSDKILINF